MEIIYLNNVSFDNNYEHLIPYEITFYSETLSKDELRALNHEKLNDIFESFEENKSSYPFSDCDDYPEPFDSDRNELEIKTLTGDNDKEIDEVVNEFEENNNDDYRYVLFYIYEECDWCPMALDQPIDMNIDKVYFRVIWTKIGDLKYIERIEMMKLNDDTLLSTIYPMTDGASTSKKYEGKVFFMLVDKNNVSITDKIEYDKDNILSAIKKAI